MKRALISVSDKTNLVDFARTLQDLGYELVSTGGTKKALEEAEIVVKGISEITHFPEILDGRVKTLHPNVHGGILAKDTSEHMTVLKEHDIVPIDLVVVNLYPFAQTIQRENVTIDDAIENIDIGGPTMVRSAAKNYSRVMVVVNPMRYNDVIDSLKKGEVTLAFREKLALEAFEHTALYDTMIANYLKKAFNDTTVSEEKTFGGKLEKSLRYGENPHQKAEFYRTNQGRGTIGDAKLLGGKELSYNNIVDLDAAWQMVNEYSKPACVIVKHTNPCGIALGETIFEAYKRAYEADSLSAFGGIIACNHQVDADTANEIVKTFMEAIVAPKFTQEALEVLKTKPNLRILETETLLTDASPWVETITGGYLLQERDKVTLAKEDLKIVTKTGADDALLEELLFAWHAVKHVKSNAIVVSNNFQTLGVGAGQMNRVGACQIAFEKAGEKSHGAVLASDAFFPFKDSIEAAKKAGIKAIIQPGGSIRDEEVIACCDENDIAMVFTGIRHFKH